MRLAKSNTFRRRNAACLSPNGRLATVAGHLHVGKMRHSGPFERRPWQHGSPRGHAASRSAEASLAEFLSRGAQPEFRPRQALAGKYQIVNLTPALDRRKRPANGGSVPIPTREPDRGNGTPDGPPTSVARRAPARDARLTQSKEEPHWAVAKVSLSGRIARGPSGELQGNHNGNCKGKDKEDHKGTKAQRREEEEGNGGGSGGRRWRRLRGG